MVANHKVTGTASSVPAGLAAAAAVSIIVTILSAGVFGYLISKEILSETGIGYFSMVIILLSTITGAAVAIAKIKKRLLFICGVFGVIYYGILLSTTALFFGGQYQGMGVTALLVFAGSGVVALLGMKGENRNYHRKHKRANC